MTNWIKGPPTRPGIHWFKIDTSFHFIREPFLFVLQTHIYKDELHTHLFGDSGSGPLECYYRKSMFDSVAFADIQRPSPEWKTLKQIKDSTRMWVRHPEGYIGFGLISKRWSGDLGGSILWLDKPHSASESGVWIKASDKYMFSPVEIPNV